LKDGSYDKMMVGGKSEAPCGADRPCPAEKAVEKPCGSGGPCPVEKPCGNGGPCPAEKPCGANKPCPAEPEVPCGKNKPCPAEQGKMVIDPATADMVPLALASSSEKTEKPTLNHFSMDSRVSDSIGFI
jgi:hypothetical protein